MNTTTQDLPKRPKLIKSRAWQHRQLSDLDQLALTEVAMVEPQYRIGDSAERAKSLDERIAMIRAANPELFHTPETLAQRRFWHKPVGDIPCSSYIEEALP